MDEKPSDVIDAAIIAAEIAAYRWTLENDVIEWSANAAAVLGLQPGRVATGRMFAALSGSGLGDSRHDIVTSGHATDGGTGVAYEIRYPFWPEGRGKGEPAWIEDRGRWFAGPNGRPARITGTVRRIGGNPQAGQRDPLNAMMTGDHMLAVLDRAISSSMTHGASIAFLIVAIGNLDAITETYGFAASQQVIAETGLRLRRIARADDVVARYSGARFGLILSQCGEDELSAAAERFLAAVRASVIATASGPVWPELFGGAVSLPRHAVDASGAIARAEDALLDARAQPCGGLSVYQPSPGRTARRSGNSRSAGAIQRCLDEGRFRLAFQPVIDARTGNVALHEALLRMTGPGGESMPAAALIPIAEKLGLVRLVDRAVMELALEVLAAYPAAKLSVNISGTTAADQAWHPEIISMLAGKPDLAERLIVEITETVALGDLSGTTRFIRSLRETGTGVAIDDFGAGFTSFRNLQAMPVQIVKIDGSFCRNLAESPGNRCFIRALIDLSQAFGLATVAEWVENEADAALLRDWGIDMMQGHLFGPASDNPPWPAAAATALPTGLSIPAVSEVEPDPQPDRLREAMRLLDQCFARPGYAG